MSRRTYRTACRPHEKDLFLATIATFSIFFSISLYTLEAQKSSKLQNQAALALLRGARD